MKMSIPADPAILYEDLRHLAAYGGSPERVATQLGTTPQALDKMLRRYPPTDPVLQRFHTDCHRWVDVERRRRKEQATT